MIVGDERETIVAPVGFGLLDALARARDEVPPDVTLAEGLAAEDDETAALVACVHDGFAIGSQDEEIVRGAALPLRWPSPR